MRINIYGEELTERTSMTVKAADGHDAPFYGVRLYLDSPDSLSSSAEDDDSSAITFWVPSGQEGHYDRTVLRNVLGDLLAHLDEIDAHVAGKFA